MENSTESEKYNCIVLLGPTAVGKTSIGVQIAHHYGQPVISADSRQTYKGLDIGSGKDISEYTVEEKLPDGTVRKVDVPYYLIDVATLDKEYNVFNYQQDFYRTFNELTASNKDRASGKKCVPVVVGGTGMYLDSVIRGYDFIPVEENKELRAELEKKSLEELDEMLLELKPDLHNKSDLVLRDRVVRAIEIALFMQSPECVELRKTLAPRPDIKPLVLGTTLERPVVHSNIEKRLRERIENEGMIEEIKGLHEQGYSWERLEKLGLEYRYVSLFLEGKIETQQEMFEQLLHAIRQFAKRQETWFRGMQKKGVFIHWLPPVLDKEERYKAALSLIDKYVEF